MQSRTGHTTKIMFERSVLLPCLHSFALVVAFIPGVRRRWSTPPAVGPHGHLAVPTGVIQLKRIPGGA